MTYHWLFCLEGGIKNPMFVQIFFINFSASKALMGNHFHILKKLIFKDDHIVADVK